jgi:hypothetical protein
VNGFENAVAPAFGLTCNPAGFLRMNPGGSLKFLLFFDFRRNWCWGWGVSGKTLLPYLNSHLFAVKSLIFFKNPLTDYSIKNTMFFVIKSNFMVIF